jgi:hypothetical protein
VYPISSLSIFTVPLGGKLEVDVTAMNDVVALSKRVDSVEKAVRIGFV